MSGGFSSPIIGGGGALVYPAIKSPNYVPGISGWSVNKDGTAEFNEISIRGSLVVGSTASGAVGVFLYSGTPGAGNPPVFASVPPGITTDPFGNTIPGVAGNPAVLNIGNANGARLGADQLGNLVAHAATGAEIRLLPGTPEIDIYDSSGVLVASIDPVNGFKLFTGQTATSFVTQFSRTGINWGLLQNFPGGTGHLQFTAPLGLISDRISVWDPVAGYPTAETWHSLGTLAGYTVTVGRYRLTPAGELELDIQVIGGGANSGTGVNFSVTLPGQYCPSVIRRFPMESGRNVTAGDPWPRVEVSTAGVVTVITAANVTASFGMNARCPLD